MIEEINLWAYEATCKCGDSKKQPNFCEGEMLYDVCIPNKCKFLMLDLIEKDFVVCIEEDA